MRRLLSAEKYPTAELRAALEVIGEFDQLSWTSATIEDLVRLASRLTGRLVVAEDVLNLRRCVGGHDVAPPEGQLDEVLHAALTADVRGRQVREVEIATGDAALAVSVEHATGRVGLAWLAGSAAKPWTVRDEVTLERLAQGMAGLVLGDHESRVRTPPGATEALQHLLSTDAVEDKVDLLSGAAQLDPEAAYRVAVFREVPRRVISPLAVLSTALRGVNESGGSTRGCIIARQAVLVLPAARAVSDVELARSRFAAERRFGIRVGVGSSGTVRRLRVSLAQARESLALGSSEDGVTNFDELGALHLLARVPIADVEGEPDVARLLDLRARGSSEHDVGIVERYCEMGSLRKAAQSLCMHHSSVDYRIKRFEQVLGFPLNTQGGRLRALVAIRLARLCDAQ